MIIHALTRIQRRTSTPAPAGRARRLATALGSVLVLTAGVFGAGALTAVPAGAAVPARAGALPCGRQFFDGPAPRLGMRFACAPVPLGYARCDGAVPASDGGQPGARGRFSKPSGLTARQIESAYRLPVGRNPHQTVAVVEAYHTPHLASWLYTYRSTLGLPACTVGSGCLRVVNQPGSRPRCPVRRAVRVGGGDFPGRGDGVGRLYGLKILVVEAASNRSVIWRWLRTPPPARRRSDLEQLRRPGERFHERLPEVLQPSRTMPSWCPRATRASRPPPSPPTSRP